MYQDKEQTSSYCTTVLISMCPGRCSNILHIAQIYCHVIFMSLDCSRKPLKGCTSVLDDSVQEAVIQWFRQQPKEFFADGIHQHVHEWDSSLNANGDFSNSCNTFTHDQPQMSFSCTCLVMEVKNAMN